MSSHAPAGRILWCSAFFMTAQPVAGFGYLILYNLIFVLPLIVILLIASDSTLLAKVQEWKKSKTRNMRLWGGIAMIVLGVIIFFL